MSNTISTSDNAGILGAHISGKNDKVSGDECSTKQGIGCKNESRSTRKAREFATLYDMIERMIEDKASDGRLPTERELAQLIGSSRHAVRQALERLEADGRILRQVGRGTFIGTAAQGDLSDSGKIAHHASPREIAEARRILEPQFAMLAALNGTASQIEAIAVHTKHCAGARNIDVYEIADESFHRSIAVATGNVMLQALFETINTVRKRIVWGKMRRAGLSRERRDILSAQHVRIYRAIANRDPEEAAEAMRVHTDAIAETYRAFDLRLRLTEPAMDKPS